MVTLYPGCAGSGSTTDGAVMPAGGPDAHTGHAVEADPRIRDGAESDGLALGTPALQQPDDVGFGRGNVQACVEATPSCPPLSGPSLILGPGHGADPPLHLRCREGPAQVVALSHITAQRVQQPPRRTALDPLALALWHRTFSQHSPLHISDDN